MSAVTLLQDAFVLRGVTYGSCALLVWDYFLTLDDEVMTYIWRSPRSIVKYLFIGNRYINLFTQPFSLAQIAGTLPLDSTAACLAFSWAFALSEQWSYGSVHLLVLLRVWVLYERTLGITIALLVAFILYLGASIAILVYILSGMHYDSTVYGLSKACWGGLPPLSWLTWIVGCVLEVCLFALTVFTLWRHFPSKSSRIPHLVRGLYIHAVIFLLANILGNVLNIVAWTVWVDSPLFDVVNSIAIVLVNITGQRLAINLRRLRIQRDISPSEVSREVEIQLAAFDDGPAAPRTLSTVEFP
ncbi:hypothetical protein V8E55_003934 [Tylopilus felleus]